MKNLKIMLAAAICAVAVSCQKDNISDNNNYREPAVISAGAQTKTSLNGMEVHWSSDDVIAVFDNAGAKNAFTAISTEGSSAEFAGSVSAGTTQLYAVYPYELAESANGSTLVVTIPADQTSKAGSFAEEHNISVAKAEKTPGVAEVGGVSFQNACALLKFTIPAYISDAQKVTISSKTAIAGQMTIDFSGESPACALSGDAVNSISMTGAYEAGSTFWFVLAPVTLDGITVNVETAKGTYSMSTDSQYEMTAGQYRNLGTLNLEKASMTGVSAAHTYTDGILTGTDVTVNLGISETVAAYITDLELEVRNAAGTTVRTLRKSSASAVETIAADAQWPYLPHGEYTVSGTYTLSGVTEKEIEPLSFTITEAPVFEIAAVTAHTSYDLYAAGNAEGANNLDGSTIYSVGAVVTVSDAILNSPNYQPLIITDNGSEVQAGNLTGSAWGTHEIKASYTLDGVTAESTSVVEVTGLPYTAAPPKNSGINPWTANSGSHQISWNNDGVKLEGTTDKQVLTSPSFHVPTEIDVNLNVPVKFYSVCVMFIHAQAQLKCRIGGKEVINRTGAKASNGMNKNKSENYTADADGTLTASKNTVEIENAYTMSAAYIYVYNVNIRYR